MRTDAPGITSMGKATSRIQRTVRQHGRDALLLAADSLYLAGRSRRAAGSTDILLVRLDGIGDYFLWLPSARLLRRHFHGARITLVAEAAFSGHAEGLDCFDEVVPIARKRFVRDLAYRFSVLADLRRRDYDLAILPCYNRVGRFRDGESIMRAVRARRKVASVGEATRGWQRRMSRRWYTELIPADMAPLHELERNAEFMRGLGIEEVTRVSRNGRAVPLPVSDVGSPAGTGLDGDLGRPRTNGAAHPSTNEAAHQLTGEAADPYYVLVPGAGFPIRKWPAERFAQLADRIGVATGMTGVICGGPQDESLGEEIKGLTSAPVRNLAGRTSLADLAEIVRCARLVVGNETGAIHMAALAKTPTVSITGGGHYGRFVPYPEDMDGPAAVTHPMPCFHCDWNCIHPLEPDQAAPCVANISLELVWSAVQNALRTGGERNDSKVGTAWHAPEAGN